MRAELSAVLEYEFDFSPLQDFTETSAKISTEKGAIRYIPTNYPLPLSKRVLSALLENKEGVRALPLPDNENALQQTIFAAIDYLLDKDGKGSVVFFCPATLTNEIPRLRGSTFVPIEKLEIKDPRHVRARVYEKLAGIKSTSTKDNLASFVLQAYFANVIGQQIPLEQLETTSISEGWNIYIPFQKLSDIEDELSDFYLESIGIRDTDIYQSLPDGAQKNVFELAFEDSYNIPHIHDRAQFLESWVDLEPYTASTFRKLAASRLVQGDAFYSPLEEFSDREGKEFVYSTNRAYSSLLQGEDKINQVNPRDAADNLIEYFGILYHDASEDEISQLMADVRGKLSEDAEHAEAYHPSKVPEILVRVDKMLHRILELDTLLESTIVEAKTNHENWIDPLRTLYRIKHENELEEYLTLTEFPALFEAKQSVEIEMAEEAEASSIQSMEPSLERLPEFASIWAGYLIDDYEGKAKSDTYRNSIVKKYDEFNDLLIDRYEHFRDSTDFDHISDIIQPDPDILQIIVVIDSLGFSDLELMKEWGMLESDPEIDPVCSNIPSYTPSAMSTILTGLTPEETGIYHWNVRNESRVLNLQRAVKDEEFEDISRGDTHSYYLIQEQDLMNSGITKFAKSLVDIELHDGFNPGETLEDLAEALDNEIESCLRVRYDVYAGNLDIPVEALRRREEAQHSTFVVYLDDFDSLLHEDLSKYEFKSYYDALSRFIDDLSSSLLGLLEEYSFDEDYELTFAADHGKITRYERDLLMSTRPQETFNRAC